MMAECSSGASCRSTFTRLLIRGEMTRVWLLAWDASCIIFTLMWALLETKLGEKLPQRGGPGGRIELREVEPLPHRLDGDTGSSPCAGEAGSPPLKTTKEHC